MADRRLFVYYKLPAATARVAGEAARAAQRALCERLDGLQAELLRRPFVAGLPEATLMETYARPGGIDAAMQAAIEAMLAAALAPWLAGGARHVEVFEPFTAEDDTRCAS
jgi:hypothetical protein